MSIALIILLVIVFVVVVTTSAFVGSGRRRTRRSSADQPSTPDTDAGATTGAPPRLGEAPEPATPKAASMASRLGRARNLLSGYFASIRTRSGIDATTWETLEEALIRADVGVASTTRLLDGLRQRVADGEINDPEALLEALKAEMYASLSDMDGSMAFKEGVTNVWLFVGVNGVGKTTTIGKVGLRESDAGRRVVMAAGDTFRAAASEQLGLWADRVGAEMVKGSEGSDPSAVIFDAIGKADAQKVDLVLADTAGRLHTKVNLMDELRKVRRIAERPPGHLSEVLLVIDATTGQNGLVQARLFAEAAGVTGIVLTKLDGTAKGGIALNIHSELGLPIKLVGLGEGPNDLIEFEPGDFVEALFA